MGAAASLLSSPTQGADSVFQRITPSSEQVDYLQDKWHELRDFISPPLGTLFALPTSTWIQGSYKYQTLLRPFADEEFDLDMGFYFGWSGGDPYRPVRLKDAVQSQLTLLVSRIPEAKSVFVPPKKRCCRVHYEKQFHIDVPVYHLNQTSDSRRLACQNDVWETSDPKTLYQWFRARIVNTDRQQVRRLICYLKAWARLRLSGDARPSSILLTVLVVESAYLSTFRTDMDDDEALAEVLAIIKNRLDASSVVENPVNRAENLNRLSPDGLRSFLSQLESARVFARAAVTAPNLLIAAQHLEWLFSYMVPFPDTVDDRVLREASRRLATVEPDVQIRVTSNDHLVGVERNQVPNARKRCTLTFQVVNSTAFPPGSLYTWTVRNRGSEAEGVNQLGHIQSGLNRTSVRESTLYNGRQSMDLTIRDPNGRLVGFRRIPVNISGDALVSPYRRVYGRR
jgi:Adenylyl/Guanylyl and SMODS C-terminal sensor domain